MSTIGHYHLAITEDTYKIIESSCKFYQCLNCDHKTMQAILELCQSRLLQIHNHPGLFQDLYILATNIHLSHPAVQGDSCLDKVIDKVTNSFSKKKEIQNFFIKIKRVFKPRDFLAQFPVEIVQKILSFLTIKDLFQVALVNREASDHFHVALQLKSNLYWNNPAIHDNAARYLKSTVAALRQFSEMKLLIDQATNMHQSIMLSPHGTLESSSSFQEERKTLESKLYELLLHPQFIYQMQADKQKQFIEALLTFDLDVNCKDERGRSPLHYTAYHNNIFFAKQLLLRGADPNLCDNDGKSPTFVALSHPSMIELMLDFGGTPFSGKTALLFNCVHHGYLESLKLFLSRMADPNIVNEAGQTPLHFAASKNRQDMAEVFFEYRANPHAEDADQNTPLFFVADNASFVQLLVDRHVDVDHQNGAGNTALHLAASNNSLAKMEALLKNHANPNIVNKRGRTPLHCAIESGHVKAVELLLKNGAVARVEESNSMDANDLAADHPEIQQLLITCKG